MSPFLPLYSKNTDLHFRGKIKAAVFSDIIRALNLWVRVDEVCVYYGWRFGGDCSAVCNTV